MVKVFTVGSFAYTPFKNEKDLNYLSENNIELTEDISEADILISQNYKHLKKYIWIYLRKKNYLIWTLEPRFDVSFSSTRKILFGSHNCHFMNIYTNDVFTSVGAFHTRIISNNIKTLPENFKLTKKKVVALMSYYDGINASAVMRDSINIDLIALRSKIALYGNQRGVLNIYGKGWPGNISKEDSRNGDWPSRKAEILADYNFNLCFENTVATNYVTEKIWDSIGNYCLPIYYGKGTNIYSLFPENSFIDYSDFESPEQLFDYIEAMSDNEYRKKLNKCIAVYNQIREKGTDYVWQKRKEPLDKIIEKIHFIVNK